MQMWTRNEARFGVRIAHFVLYGRSVSAPQAFQGSRANDEE